MNNSSPVQNSVEMMCAFIAVFPGNLNRHCRTHAVLRCCETTRPATQSPSSLQHAYKNAVTPAVVFVLGGPGSGKGTQCALIQQEFQLPQLCVGDLLRQEAKSNSQTGKSVAEIMQRGEIVPGHVTMSILRRELSLLAGSYSAVLIDGFPRAMDQALQFEQLVTLCEFVVFFRCDPPVMLQRLRHRAITSGRADDVEGVFRRRLETFHSTTMPVVEYYRERGLLREIDAQNGDLHDVFGRTKILFEDLALRKRL